MIDQPQQSTTSSDESHRRGALVLRTLPILLIPIGVTIASVLIVRFVFGAPQLAPRPGGATGFAPLTFIVVLVTFCAGLIMLVRLRRPTISALLLIGAWTLVTTGVSLQMGVDTFFPAMLIIPICAAGLLIDKVASISLAALATLLIVSVAWLQLQGFLSPELPPRFVRLQMPYMAASFWIGLFWTVAALTSLLAGGLQQALGKSRRQAEELRTLSEQLEARVQEQTGKLLAQEREAAMLEERARLAREIHDTLAQGLAGIVVQLGAAQRAFSADRSKEAGEHFGLADRMAREALAEARRSVWSLRAAALERGDLGDALRGLTERQTTATFVVRFEQCGATRQLSADIESALLRVGQEALANVAKHAYASQVDLTLEYAPDRISLTISDDGVGFPADVLVRPAMPGPWGGFGLLGMRERLTALGGLLELCNHNGAVVVASVPCRGDKVTR
jgi:signal transduction histidine kinase